MSNPNPQDKPEAQPALAASACSASYEVARIAHAFDDEGRKQAVRWLAYRVRQLENELRYCLVVIDTNLKCENDLRIEYAKSLVTPNNQAQPCSTEIMSGQNSTDKPMNETKCPSCYGTGEWETECCNGSGGCSCHGQIVPMGRCNVCGGTGKVPVNITEEQRMANRHAIAGLCFTGSGPSTGLWAGKGARGNFV